MEATHRSWALDRKKDRAGVRRAKEKTAQESPDISEVKRSTEQLGLYSDGLGDSGNWDGGAGWGGHGRL